MRLYQYLFYKIYCGLRNLGNWELADKAMLALSTLEGINIMVLGITSGVFPLIENYDPEKYYQTDAIVIGLFLLAINSYLFLRKKKYLEIEKRFKKESKTQKLVGDIVVSLYALATVVSMFMV